MVYKIPVLKPAKFMVEESTIESRIVVDEITVRCFLGYGHPGAHQTSVRDEIVAFDRPSL